MDIFSYGIYLPIVTLALSFMVHGMYSPIVTLTVSVMVYTHLL
jgi:hypothetical protein